MAIVKDQALPPSLAEGFTKLVRRQWAPDPEHTICGIAKSARTINEPRVYGSLTELSQRVGYWFKQRWQYEVAQGDMSQFYLDRKNDILTGTFPSKYWIELSPVEDMTEKGVPPWVLPYEKPINPDYYDANRLPSNCPITEIRDTYSTPLDDGTEAQPAPGWKGQVEDGLFRDLYQAQRRLTFELPYLWYGDGRAWPVLKLNAEIDATASFRGNVIWFIVHTKQFFWWSNHDGQEIPNAVHTNWREDYRLPLVIPDEDLGGWNYTYSAPIVRTGMTNIVRTGYPYCDRLTVRIATPPSRGLYFSRNDAVTVRSRVTPQLFLTKTPND